MGRKLVYGIPRRGFVNTKHVGHSIIKYMWRLISGKTWYQRKYQQAVVQKNININSLKDVDMHTLLVTINNLAMRMFQGYEKSQTKTIVTAIPTLLESQLR